MTSRDIWERDYRPHLLDVDRNRVDVEGSREALQRGAEREKWTYYGPLFIWEQMRRSLGDLCMYESLVLDPGWIHDFNRAYTDHLKAHFKILLEEALPLILEVGFDGLDPMEVAAGNEILKFAEDCGDRLVFIGGFNKRIIESHDKELIRKEATTFMWEMKAREASFLFGSDHSISTNTNYEDFKCLVEVYREEAMY